MKQETNKEMELMLRRLARRDGVRLPEGNGNVVSEQHMDVDELNAYAEHALPSAARARYTEHLADCAKCREIVAGLSASFGQPVVEKVKSPEGKSSLKTFLATLLSPMFTRYAIPTLALVGIVGIAVIVFRQEPASRNTLSGPGEQKEVAQANQPATANYSYDTQPKIQDGAVQYKATPEVKTVDSLNKDAAPAKSGDQPSAAAPAEAPPPPVSEPKPAKLAEAEAGHREADTDQKRPASAVRQEQQPADEVATRGRDKENAKKEDQADDRAPSGPAKNTVARAADVSRQQVAKSKAAPAPATTAAGAGGKFANAEVEEKRKDASEVRTVAGRRFQREGDAWVDTAYVSGRDTMNVSRGSEQYRALIADEPEIRTIAETLGGEVVVIWKGRAYRIK